MPFDTPFAFSFVPAVLRCRAPEAVEAISRTVSVGRDGKMRRDDECWLLLPPRNQEGMEEFFRSEAPYRAGLRPGSRGQMDREEVAGGVVCSADYGIIHGS